MSRKFATAGVSLCDVLDDAQVVGSRPGPVTSCKSAWDRVEPGDVFVAISTGHHDGHDHVQTALQRGAVAVICERHLPVFGVTQLIVSDSRDAYGRLCQALAGSPAEEMKVVGITGTSGKTCVATLFDAVLTAAGANVGSLSSIGCSMAGDPGSTTAEADAQVIADWLRRMVSGGCSHGIVELSSTALAQRRAAGVELDAVCITNVDRDHLQSHGSMENYRRAKERIFSHLQPHGVAVLNADDQHCCRLLSEVHNPVLTYGLKQSAEVTARIVEQFVGEQTFLIQAGDDSVAVRSRIIGQHHVYNCLAAATLGLAYGIDLRTIAAGLEAVERIPGRIDRVEFGQSYGLWLDAADSPHQLRATLGAVGEVTPGRVICSLLPRASYTRGVRRQLYQVLRRLSDISVIAEERLNCQRNDPTDGARAIAWALEKAEPGDSVLVAASPDSPIGRLNRGHTAVARQWLRDVALAPQVAGAA